MFSPNPPFPSLRLRCVSHCFPEERNLSESPWRSPLPWLLVSAAATSFTLSWDVWMFEPTLPIKLSWIPSRSNSPPFRLLEDPSPCSNPNDGIKFWRQFGCATRGRLFDYVLTSLMFRSPLCRLHLPFVSHVTICPLSFFPSCESVQQPFFPSPTRGESDAMTK